MQIVQLVSKEDILAKLAEIEDMLQRATCDGESLRDAGITEIDDAVSTLTQAVDYYLD
jgi:hypothetical protein